MFVVVITMLLRVWLPDRPGALGHVASRIGALGGDVVGIEILERGAGVAIDELAVDLPDDADVSTLVAAVAAVDGVAVEDVHPAPGPRRDATLQVLECAHRIVCASSAMRAQVLCSELAELLAADWVAVLDRDGNVVATIGEVPNREWLGAFVSGALHLPADDDVHRPGDVAWGVLDARDEVVVAGRSAMVFRQRERDELSLLARLTGASGGRSGSVGLDPGTGAFDGAAPLPVEPVGRLAIEVG